MKLKPIVMIVASSLLIPSVFAASDAQRGQQLAMQGDGSGAPCLACHGANGEGNAAGAFPMLAGLDEGYLFRTMKAYQDGTRVNPVMSMNIDNFKEQDLLDLAAYFSQLSVPKPSAPSATTELLEAGEKLATLGNWDAYIPPCSSCHGPNNQGVDENFPRIAGQHASYIEQQLKAWQQGQRTSDPVQLMEAIAKRLSDEQIKAVAAYLASQPAQ
ncbi:c-type cytochrome [Pseudidiomarina marina]|uniref:Cytochrome c4 n=1 Tax=Pseudidiomarina marina TaxID=502366 RepID=A0A432YD75_9GAMM|nr:cytochrome c [Pseudidiomarina marina]PHR65783.1 MAG: cytochrome c4 [Idiomarina sp.]RUO58877.1 cytochrome c4 [Pseudidiomarina marina]